jgi:hypothetical protein
MSRIRSRVLGWVCRHSRLMNSQYGRATVPSINIDIRTNLIFTILCINKCSDMSAFIKSPVSLFSTKISSPLIGLGLVRIPVIDFSEECNQSTLAFQVLLEQARQPTWRLWARDAAIEKKDLLKARGYSWNPGEAGRPNCWYRDVSDPEKAAEVSWPRADVIGRGQAVWALRITARDRYSDRCWGWGERLGIALE